MNLEDERMPKSEQSWDCGAIPGTVTATMSGGTLTVSGTGAMRDYVDEYDIYDTPCKSFRRSIAGLVIEDGVTVIGKDAFRGCKGMTSVTIPNSVVSIGHGAFPCCFGLKSVAIPDSVRYIGDCAFIGCDSLASAAIGAGVAYIGELAFADGNSLASIRIPKSVKKIGARAFRGSTGLTGIEVEDGNAAYCSVDGVLFNRGKDRLIAYPAGRRGAYAIPDGVKSIEETAFYYCRGMTSVIIPNSVKSIGKDAFHECLRLTSVAIPGSVAYIGEDAFHECHGLASITIPGSVAAMGDGVFSGCSRLASVACLNPVPPKIGAETFAYAGVRIDAPLCLYVPQGSIDAYRSARGWKEIPSIEAAPVSV
jgi:hypothetical protein